MSQSKDMYVRHVRTGEIKKVSAEQREKQDKNYWVRVTGKDVKETAPEVAPSAEVEPTQKTTPKANKPGE
ncbi:hypothetical protein BIU97_10395 [Curtobacterium sp. MCBA15_009]|uniref:hypothetical protein n=1 Tax=Curtobacterium sp. MCBA15_009 TaxID=1898737 RepID=UPI0008DC7A33|nr:hypothetical protein [Curtobacterium sp. MCBA15_009]OII10528.1 hypothetical protein BIU97_10395 [Curtobacterium sp. MCBA15_009]